MPIARAPGTQPIFCDATIETYVQISRADYDRWMRSSQTIAELEAEVDRISSELSRSHIPVPDTEDDEFRAGII